MGITVSGFQLAMEMYGAKRLEDQEAAKYQFICVPCFEIKGVKLLHSGTNYVVVKDKKLSLDFIKKVLLEKVGQDSMCGEHFEYDKILSIKGLITLATLIDDKYSQEFVDSILNEIYQKLIQDTLNLFNVSKDKFCNSDFRNKLEKLYELVDEFDKLVNPFATGKFLLKQPAEYVDKLDIWNMSDEAFVSINAGLLKTEFYATASEWHYICIFDSIKDERLSEDCLIVEHRCEKNRASREAIETVKCFKRTVGKFDKTLSAFSDDVELDLRTGRVYKASSGAEKCRFATVEELEILIKNFKICIEAINNDIINAFLSKNSQ